jgi:transcriptional regulator with GAF, ATPase, and Fis domain
MAAQQVDPLVRLWTTSEAVAALRQIQDGEEPLDEVLARVADTAARATPDADSVSITVLTEGERARTAACTDDRVRGLDDRQYASGRGPCLEAARIPRPVRVALAVDQDHRWPEFVGAAREQGVQASVSAPLLVTGCDGADELVGSLNIYSRRATAFDPFDEGLVLLYALAASMAVTNARRWQQARATVEQLQRALLSRSEIDQAKGVFRVLYGLDDDDAFTMLKQQSQDRNVKLREVAREVLDAVRLTETTPHTTRTSPHRVRPVMRCR